MQLPRRLTEDERLNATMESMSLAGVPVFHQILDGRLVSEDLVNVGIRDLHAGIMDCSLVYALSDEGDIGLPIASFVADKTLRNATLQQLLSRDRMRRSRRLGRRTGGWVYSYCACLIRDYDYIASVFVPCHLHSLRPDARLVATVVDDGTQVARNKHYRRWSLREE